MRKIVKMAFIIIVVVMVCSPAFADDSGAQKKRWEFDLAPFYLWAANLSGDVAIGRVTLPVELDFGQIFDNLEAFFTIHFEARSIKKWGVFLDFSNLDVGGQQIGPLGGTIDVDFKYRLGELGFLYQIYATQSHTLEAIAGFRYTDLKLNLNFSILGLPVDVSQDWTDLMVGLQYALSISEKWRLHLRGDVGGFGIGSSSDMALNFLGLAEWQPLRWISFLGGYRAYYNDFKDGSGPFEFRYDVLVHGPVIAANFKF